MDTLAKLFGSAAKVKLMRLFLLNPDAAFPTKEVLRRSRVAVPTARRELRLLADIGLISRKDKSRGAVWQLDSSFPFLANLRALVKSNLLDKRQDLIKQFNRCGRISLLIASGVLIEDNDSRTDLLVVGDRLKRGALDRTVKLLEAELGRELNYAVMGTADFAYRLNASDKFIRDVLEYPHERLIDRLA